MKAITLTAPYGSLIALAERYPDLGKRIETRGWSRSYRGPLAIHQAKGLGPVGGKRGLIELIERKPFWSVLREAFAVQLGDERHYPADAETIVDELPFGAIVATCNLVGIIKTQSFEDSATQYYGYPEYGWTLTDQERAFGDYSPDRFAWLLADIRALPEPVPARGALGLWEYEGELGL